MFGQDILERQSDMPEDQIQVGGDPWHDSLDAEIEHRRNYKKIYGPTRASDLSIQFELDQVY